MSGGWLDVQDSDGKRRHALTDGLTRIGGAGAELPLADVGNDQVHVWNDPPRAIFVGTGARPTLNGEPLHEQALKPGDDLAWKGAHFVYGGTPAREHEASLVELAEAHAPTPAPVAGATTLSSREERIWNRFVAGMLVELGIADRAAAKRWQGEVVGGRFDADQCAREILARSGVPSDDERLEQRSARLLRDFLMAPLMKGMRGASRRAKRAAQGGVAYVLAQVVALGIYSLLVLASLLLLRIRDYDLNGLLDTILRRG